MHETLAMRSKIDATVHYEALKIRSNRVLSRALGLACVFSWSLMDFRAILLDFSMILAPFAAFFDQRSSICALFLHLGAPWRALVKELWRLFPFIESLRALLLAHRLLCHRFGTIGSSKRLAKRIAFRRDAYRSLLYVVSASYPHASSLLHARAANESLDETICKKKTIGFRRDAHRALWCVLSASSPHASSLVYIYIYIYIRPRFDSV